MVRAATISPSRPFSPHGSRRLGPSLIRDFLRICVYLRLSRRFALRPLSRFAESDPIARFLGPRPHLGEVRHQFILINRVSRYPRDTVSR